MTAATIGLSHSPLIGKNDPAPAVLARVDEAVTTAKEFIRDFDPELVVLYALPLQRLLLRGNARSAGVVSGLRWSVA